MSETNCDHCTGLACGDECNGKSHATPSMDVLQRGLVEGQCRAIEKEHKMNATTEQKKEPCSECGAPYPLAHAPYCKVGEAFQ